MWSKNIIRRLAFLAVLISGVFIIALPKPAPLPGEGTGGDTGLLPAPVGVLTGSVRDVHGVGLGGVEVAVFDAESLDLIEHTTSDELGRFAFSVVPSVMHIYAMPADFHSLTGQWLFDLEAATTSLVEVTLHPGYPVSVTVKDPSGAPIVGAEVRAYDSTVDLAGNVALKATAITDANGVAALLAPRRTHLAVMDEASGYLPTWKFWQYVSNTGKSYDLTLEKGVPMSGRVLSDAYEPLGGIIVSAWAYKNGWHWSGYRKTEADGSFMVMGGGKWTRVTAVDPDSEFVSSTRWYRTSGTNLPDILLPEGNPLTVRCVDPDGAGVRSRVWFYSYENRSWSWGGLTDDFGALQGMVSASHAIIARPLSKDFIGANLWRQTYGANEAEITFKPARWVDLTVTSKGSGEPLANLDIRGYVDDWVWIGRGATDEAGKLRLRMPTLGMGRFYVRDRSPDSLIKPGWYNLNLAVTGSSLNLALDTLTIIEGRVETLDGQLVTEEVMVTSWNADRWGQTGRWRTSTGHFRIAVPERYHLRVMAVDQDSRLFPTWHWWNERPADLVHARTPVRMAKGWFGDVQVQSVESGGPVRGVRIHGGYPRRITADDGWARHMLFRPVYTLRNYPPPVSSSQPNPIIPDLMRVHQTIEGDRTEAAGAALDPIKVFTEVGTIARGRVEGPLPGGGTGPISGVRVKAYGGRRPLGWAMTNARGEFNVLAVKHTPEHEFTTNILLWPRYTDPYLPAFLRGLELTANTAAGEQDDVGLVSLDGAAYGEGKVVDAFGDAITDRTVFYIARRQDKGPRWRLGGWRVKPNGQFTTKIAPKMWFRFLTRFWNNTWENKYFTEEYQYNLGDTVQLGDVELGKAALVEVRAVTSVADAGGSAAPIAQVYVEVIDDATGRVYDWRRTDGSGEVQLRAPHNVPVRLRYSFWHWTYTVAGVGFNPVASDVFSPQLSDVFTLTADKTDFGDVFITSPLRLEMDAFLRFLHESPASAFSSAAARRALYSLASTAGRIPTPAGSKLDTKIAKRLVNAGFEMFTDVSDSIPTSITDPTVRAEAVSLANAVLNDLALLLDSLEDK